MSAISMIQGFKKKAWNFEDFDTFGAVLLLSLLNPPCWWYRMLGIICLLITSDILKGVKKKEFKFLMYFFLFYSSVVKSKWNPVVISINLLNYSWWLVVKHDICFNKQTFPCQHNDVKIGRCYGTISWR